jgi:hypothetical protein
MRGGGDAYTVIKDPMFEQKKKEYLSKRSEDIDLLRGEIKRLSDPNEVKTDFATARPPASIELEKTALQKAKEDYDKLQALVTAIEEGNALPVIGTKWYDPYRDMISRIASYSSKLTEVDEARKKKTREIEVSADSNQKMKDNLYWENFFATEKLRLNSSLEEQQLQLEALLKDYRSTSLVTSQADLEQARLAYQAAKDAIDVKQKAVDAEFEIFVKDREEDTETYRKRLIEILAETKAFLEENLVAETKQQLANLNEKSKIELADLKKRSDGEIYSTQVDATTGQFDWQRKRAEIRLPDLHMDAEKDRATLLEKYKEYEEKILTDAEINWNSIQDIYFDDLKIKNDWSLMKPVRYFDIMADSSKKQTEILKSKADIASFEPSQKVVEDSLKQEGAAKFALDSAIISGNKDAVSVAQRTYEIAKASAEKAKSDAAVAEQMKQDLKAKEATILFESNEALAKRKLDVQVQEIKVPVDNTPLKEVISTSGEILASLPPQYTNTPEYKKALEAIANARKLLESM